ncbi:MAG: hypothetical protein HY700_05160 [Gemmatimonadetes bacterium]|nr:hypothetical protein [Gemmatimonadota bacterium]
MNHRTLIAAGVAVAAAISGTACGRTTHESRDTSVTTEADVSSRAPVTMEVTNSHKQDVDVFVTDGDTRWRMGTVATGQTLTFTVPSSAVRTGNGLHVLVHPIGGGRDFSSDRIIVSAGDEVQLTVAPAIAQTSYSVAPR